MSFVAMPLLQACGSFLFFTQASLSKEDQQPCHNNGQHSLCGACYEVETSSFFGVCDGGICCFSSGSEKATV